MHQRFPAAMAAALTLLVPTIGLAGPCDAHFPLDGNLDDVLGGQHAAFIDTAGEPAAAPGEFVAGKFGKALRLDGSTIAMSPLSLQMENCRQITITAWIYLESLPKNANNLVSTGFGRGPRLWVAGNNLSAWGGSNEIRGARAVRPGIWIFVAGVWDYQEDKHMLLWRLRQLTENMGENQRPPQEGFWIGAHAYGSSFQGITNGVLIDDIRVYGRELSITELRVMQKERCNCGEPLVERDTGIDLEAALGDRRPTGPLEFPEGQEPAPAEAGPAPAEEAPAPAPAEPVTGEPYPVGEPSYTLVAGFEGTNKRELAFDDDFLAGIRWEDASDVPCAILVESQRPRLGIPPSLEFGCSWGLVHPVPCCRNGVAIDGAAVTSLRVCSGGTSERLKGLRIAGSKVLEDGSIAYSPAEDQDALPRCDGWSGLMVCPTDRAATGVVVHSNDRSGDKEVIVGLQLICRKVGVR